MKPIEEKICKNCINWNSDSVIVPIDAECGLLSCCEGSHHETFVDDDDESIRFKLIVNTDPDFYCKYFIPKEVTHDKK